MSKDKFNEGISITDNSLINNFLNILRFHADFGISFFGDKFPIEEFKKYVYVIDSSSIVEFFRSPEGIDFTKLVIEDYICNLINGDAISNESFASDFHNQIVLLNDYLSTSSKLKNDGIKKLLDFLIPIYSTDRVPDFSYFLLEYIKDKLREYDHSESEYFNLFSSVILNSEYCELNNITAYKRANSTLKEFHDAFFSTMIIDIRNEIQNNHYEKNEVDLPIETYFDYLVNLTCNFYKKNDVFLKKFEGFSLYFSGIKYFKSKLYPFDNGVSDLYKKTFTESMHLIFYYLYLDLEFEFICNKISKQTDTSPNLLNFIYRYIISIKLKLLNPNACELRHLSDHLDKICKTNIFQSHNVTLTTRETITNFIQKYTALKALNSDKYSFDYPNIANKWNYLCKQQKMNQLLSTHSN